MIRSRQKLSATLEYSEYLLEDGSVYPNPALLCSLWAALRVCPKTATCLSVLGWLNAAQILCVSITRKKFPKDLDSSWTARSTLEFTWCLNSKLRCSMWARLTVSLKTSVQLSPHAKYRRGLEGSSSILVISGRRLGRRCERSKCLEPQNNDRTRCMATNPGPLAFNTYASPLLKAAIHLGLDSVHTLADVWLYWRRYVGKDRLVPEITCSDTTEVPSQI